MSAEHKLWQLWTPHMLKNTKITKIEKTQFQNREKKFQNGPKNSIFQTTFHFFEGPQIFFSKNKWSEVPRIPGTTLRNFCITNIILWAENKYFELTPRTKRVKLSPKMIKILVSNQEEISFSPYLFRKKPCRVQKKKPYR